MQPLLAILALLLSSSSWTTVEVDHTAYLEIQSALKKKIPANWTVDFDEKYNYLIISSDAKVLLDILQPNMSENEPPVLDTFHIAFRVLPFVSESEFKSLKTHNLVIRRQMALLQTSMFHIPHKYDEYRSSNPDSKKLIANYENLKGQLQELPVFHFKTVCSLFPIASGAPDYSAESYTQEISDSNIQSKYRHIVKDILSVLARYNTEQDAAANP